MGENDQGQRRERERERGRERERERFHKVVGEEKGKVKFVQKV